MKPDEGIKLGKITVEVNGVPIDITQLPRDYYEYFLDSMMQVRAAYKALREKSNLDQQSSTTTDD